MSHLNNASCLICHLHLDVDSQNHFESYILMMKEPEWPCGANPFASPPHYTNRTRMSKKEMSIVLNHWYIGVYLLQGSYPNNYFRKDFPEKKKKWNSPWNLRVMKKHISLVGKAWAKTTRLGGSLKEWLKVETSQPPQLWLLLL